MNLNDQEMISEESEDDGAGESREEMIYRRKYQMLLERCEVLQQVSIKNVVINFFYFCIFLGTIRLYFIFIWKIVAFYLHFIILYNVVKCK